FLVGDSHGLFLRLPKKSALLGSCFAALASEANDLRPALHETVVGERLGRTLLALAEGVETISQFASDLRFGTQLSDEFSRRVFAAAREYADQVVNDFPRAQARIGRRVPVFGQFLGAQKSHSAALRFEDAGRSQAGDTRVLRLRELLGYAVFA